LSSASSACTRRSRANLSLTFTSRPAARWRSGSVIRPGSRPDPAAAIDSFAGVGYFLDLAAIEADERLLDLGSGSGTDSFLAAVAAGAAGGVVGIDMMRSW